MCSKYSARLTITHLQHAPRSLHSNTDLCHVCAEQQKVTGGNLGLELPLNTELLYLNRWIYSHYCPVSRNLSSSWVIYINSSVSRDYQACSSMRNCVEWKQHLVAHTLELLSLFCWAYKVLCFSSPATFRMFSHWSQRGNQQWRPPQLHIRLCWGDWSTSRRDCSVWQPPNSPKIFQ